MRPIHTGPLPEALAAHLRHYVNFQQHVVKAALSGDRKAALHAFLLDPTLQSRLDLDQTQALLDEMLEANRRLPAAVRTLGVAPFYRPKQSFPAQEVHSSAPVSTSVRRARCDPWATNWVTATSSNEP